MRSFARFSLSLVLALTFGGAALGDQVIIRTKKPYASVKQKIAALGGTVTYEFQNADGLAADVPAAKVNSLASIPGVQYYVRDLTIPNPSPKVVIDVSSQLSGDPATAVPNNYYPYNVDLTDAGPLFAGGHFGQGVVVGIIDSGTSRTAAALCYGPCATGTRVLVGESFVPGEPDANAATNYPHGTWVACNIGANVAFLFAHNGGLATAVRTYCTPAASAPCSFQVSAAADAIPMVGQAPAAHFFPLKVFPASGAGAPESRILQAMDRAIQLKNSTQPNMKVVNMSLGGATLFAGGDIEDELATSMAAAGISLVVSAGNAGPSGMTVGSPGTAHKILTVGAASSPVHERILRDLQFGAGIGPFYRPDNNQQMAYFSSRGPDADGRNDPDIVANGLASYTQGANGSISLVSGTSLSAPTISGIAATLYSANPSATPDQVRSALLRSARPGVIPSAGPLDQGAGYVDAAAAKALLDAGVASVADSGPAKKKVAQNVQEGAGIQPINASQYSAHVSGLRPAERREFFYVVDKGTSSVSVTLANVTPALPPAQQNQLFGDDVLFTVHSAKTSSIGEGDYLAFAFIGSGQSFTFDNPETGLMRITVNGDWTNAGTVGADVQIQSTKAPLSKVDFKGTIGNGGLVAHTVSIPAGTASVTFGLSWDNDWSAYPTNDIDMILQAPNGSFNFNGASLNSPETVTIANPQPGTWTIYVSGATVYGGDDKYEVRVDY
jgi:subtilisin family serine protease